MKLSRLLSLKELSTHYLTQKYAFTNAINRRGMIIQLQTEHRSPSHTVPLNQRDEKRRWRKKKP